MKNQDYVARIERAIRTIRQRIFDMPEAKAQRAGQAIAALKARIYPRHHIARTTHWMYACE
jgi:hypothetical protein